MDVESTRQILTAQDESAIYKSNSFKLQTAALLATIYPKQSHRALLDPFLLQLHTALHAIPASPKYSALHPLDAAHSLIRDHAVSVPYCLPLPTPDVLWSVGFAPVDRVTLVGSYPNTIGVKPRDELLGSGVDLAVHMPNALFQEKDYLDARYFHKRAFFLAYLAKSLSQDSRYSRSVRFSYYFPARDPRRVVLLLRPRNDTDPAFPPKLKFHIRIIPVLHYTNPISISHLSPAHSNIRLSPPTHTHTHTNIYNTTLLQQSALPQHIVHTHALLAAAPAARDAIALLRVWANQRAYSCVRSSSSSNVANAAAAPASIVLLGFADLGGVFWTALVSLLLFGEIGAGGKTRKVLGKGLSSYQLFRAALDFLCTVIIAAGDGLQEHRLSGEVVFR